jgi:hypothetical protein
VAEIGEAAAQPLLMRIQHAAQHEFAAGGDEFDVHKISQKETMKPAKDTKNFKKSDRRRPGKSPGVFALSAPAALII